MVSAYAGHGKSCVLHSQLGSQKGRCHPPNGIENVTRADDACVWNCTMNYYTHVKIIPARHVMCVQCWKHHLQIHMFRVFARDQWMQRYDHTTITSAWDVGVRVHFVLHLASSMIAGSRNSSIPALLHRSANCPKHCAPFLK